MSVPPLAYKWTTGTVSGSVTNLRVGDKVKVALTPVNSNDDYSMDLAKNEMVTAGSDSTASYEFDNVADGRYRVVLEAKAGSWREKESTVLDVMQEEDEKEGAEVAVADLSATDVRGVIRGRIANDSNKRSGLTSDESMAGVEVVLYSARKVKEEYVADEKVAMAETDGDGVFLFEGLVEGDMYFVKPVSTSLYTAVRSGNDMIVGDKTTDVVSHALAKAMDAPKNGTEPAIPMWNYHTSMVSFDTAVDSDNSFALLYKDGEVEGMVKDPGARKAHRRVVVELRQCKTTDFNDQDTVDPLDDTLTRCTDYTDVEVEASVDTKGNWSVDGLMEGVYEVIPDLPAGYINVAPDGTDDETVEGYYSQQMVELMGGRADDDTETFWIKDRNAESDATVNSYTINGETVSGTVDIDKDYFFINVNASDDATVRLLSGSNSQAVANGDSTKVMLSEAGTRSYKILVTAEDGFAKDSSTVFSVRRDADVRAKMVTLEWSGDRIELDRNELGLNPDRDAATGSTRTIRVTVDKGDNNGAIPTTALTVMVSSMTEGFGVVVFVDSDSDTCNFSSTTSSGSVTLEANTDAAKGSDDICFQIMDKKKSDMDDKNDDNHRSYRLILTRK